MGRRKFLKKSILTTGCVLSPGISIPGILPITNNKAPIRISELENPVAIAMWDYSWILRHHRYGEFENWDRVLEELAARGYDAIRIDAMPQFVAADTDGQISNTFRSVKTDWTPSLWGNDYTMTFNPREALLEFLPVCQQHGIKVGLASWFLRHGTARKDIFLEEGGLLRAWVETLDFLSDNNLLENVMYVDLLNEYPNWHGYDWFKNEMNKRSDMDKFLLDNPEANAPPEDANFGKSRTNPLQQQFYNEFIQSTISPLKDKFPDLDFFVSLDSAMDLQLIDLSRFNALDYHIWFEHSGRIPGLDTIRSRNPESDYRKTYSGLTSYWKENKESLIKWMDERISSISKTARENNIVCGNTEGWGPIFWFDHPELDWKWVKESAEICVELALRHDNYKFICTSNFTHPQFKGMWEDLKWHQQITKKIKKGE
ncbi:MAG: cellulase-like family protein [Cyclobacteriaceae bacterium]